METNPTNYNLPQRTQLKELGFNKLGILKIIKSRIIQKDAAKIIDTANQIRKTNPDLSISLICTSNICSKSVALLKSEGIDIIYEEL